MILLFFHMENSGTNNYMYFYNKNIYYTQYIYITFDGDDDDCRKFGYIVIFFYFMDADHLFQRSFYRWKLEIIDQYITALLLYLFLNKYMLFIYNYGYFFFKKKKRCK